MLLVLPVGELQLRRIGDSVRTTQSVAGLGLDGVAAGTGQT